MSVDIDLWSTEDVAQRTGLSVRVLHRWIAANAIHPHTGPAGTGSPLRWSSDDLARLAAIAEVCFDLRELGIHNIPSRFIARLWDAGARGDGELVTATVTVRVRRGLEDG